MWAVTGDDRRALVLTAGWSGRWVTTWKVAGREVTCPAAGMGGFPVPGCGPVRHFTWRTHQGHRPGLQTPDFLAVTGEGTWLLDVRPADRIEAADRVKFAASAEAALACGWQYGVVGGWQPHVMTTLDTLSAQRRPLSDPLGLTEVLLAVAVGGPVRFADLVAAACYPAVARAFAIRLIWRRVLAIDLAEPFGDSSLVWRGAARGGQ